MTVVRRPPPRAPKPPQADQKTSESRIPSAPTATRIQPIVLYVVTGDEVLILHIAHGRRDLDALLADD